MREIKKEEERLRKKDRIVNYDYIFNHSLPDQRVANPITDSETKENSIVKTVNNTKYWDIFQKETQYDESRSING